MLLLSYRPASPILRIGMPTDSFFTSLAIESQRVDSLLCVGLDPSLDIPTRDVLPWMKAVIDATSPFVCAYKPNSAFYEARGIDGWNILEELISHAHAAGRMVILDAKRGDIASTAEAYAKASFDVMGADAVTVNPLLGGDSVESFACRAEKGVFLLCHTSNPGARDLQELQVNGRPFFELVAEKAQGWNTRGNIGLVVGATFPGMLARVRAMSPDMWILLPGVGAQGGDLEASLAAGLDSAGGGVLVNVSRDVCRAADPGSAARGYRDRINAARKMRPAGRPAAGSAARPAGPAASAPHDSLLDEVALGLHTLGAIRFGEFTLKSGKKSPLYIDLRLLVSDPSLMALVARALGDILAPLRFDRIAAIPYGGLPIGQAVALATGKPLLYPRREAKDYGTRKLIEGVFSPGETVVVLDDLVTTGASKIEALAPLVEAGLNVKDVVVLVDREQGGGAELAEHGLTLHAALTLSRILDCLVRHGRLRDSARADIHAALGTS
jgi:uridine monophosphate synthetase